MRKKTVLLLNIILLAGVVAYLFLTPALRGAIYYPGGKAERIEALKKEKRPAAEPFFTDLLFSGEKLPYDKTTSTFYLPLNMEEEAWETGELTSGQEEVSLLFAGRFSDTDKRTAIREGTRFPFYALKGGEYQECYLVVTGLPILSIETNADADADSEVFGGMAHFWDSDTKVNWASSSILEGHIRGNTSRIYPKKGYKLTLKKQDKNGNVVADKKSLFGMRKDDEWILNAMYTDSSKMRDKLSDDLWNAFGAKKTEYPNAKFATDFTYVEVFFNGEYWGLYGLLEPVDAKQLDLTKEGDAGQTEYSYKAIVPQMVATDKLDEIEEFGKDVAGFELKGKHSSIGKEDWAPLFTYLKLRDYSDDETFREKADEVFDTDGALDVWIYLQAVLGIDNRAKNMYYVAKGSKNLQKIYFVPWDMDLTWGDCISESQGGEYPWDIGLLTALYSERINWNIGDRLVELDVDNARERVAERWKELRSGVLSDEAINEAVDRMIHQTRDSGAYGRNEERWPEGYNGADYEQMKRLSVYRMRILDYYFDGHLEAYLGLGYE